MSKDIRSFFQVLSKKPGDQAKHLVNPKKTVVLVESDDEDFVDNTPKKPSPKKEKPAKRRAQILSSDSEDEGKPKKNKSPAKKQKNAVEKETSKLRPVNFDALNRAIKQSKVEHLPKEEASKNDDKSSHKRKDTKKKDTKKSKNKKNTEMGIHGDKNFEKTLKELDEDSDDTILLDNLDILDRTIEEAQFSAKINDNHNDSIKKDNTNVSGDKKHEVKEKEDGFSKDKKLVKEGKEINRETKMNEKTHTKDPNLEQGPSHHGKGKHNEKSKEKRYEEKDTPKKAEKRQRRNSGTTPTPMKKQKLEHIDSGLDPDQEKWEKKRYSAGLYQAYLQRPGPKNQGQKVYPKGKPDCFSGLTFLRTGVLDSLDGEEFQSLVSDHGGKVVHSVSKKVNYVIVGEEPGPAKLEKAKHYKIPEMSEDDFLDMILTKSGMKPRYAVKNISEDLGLGSSETGSEEFTDINFMTKENSSEKVEESYSKEFEKKEASCVKELDRKVDTKIQDEKITSVGVNESKEKNSSVENSGEAENKHIPAKNTKEAIVDLQSSRISAATNLCWTEKYKPRNMKEVIGQQDSNSNMNKLKRWLENWFKNQEPERRKKMTKPSPFRPCAGGEYYKAALLSGPPGVGKTTTATLVAKELGFDIVEFNASDTRNKKLLHEEISQMMNSKTVAGFASGDKHVNKKRVLLMDEVDGMAGNEDRGGIAELISFIKTANFPIICMCNNREHQKMRTLVNYCFELRFGKPNVNQVRGAMLSICFKEGLKIKPDALARLITGTGCDIRQTLNHLTMWSAAEKELSTDVVQKESKNSQKDVVMGPWDVIRTVFTKSMNKDMSLSDKSRLFFYDYSLGPLFVQENYYYVKPECTSSRKADEEELIRRYLAADSLSKSDVVERKIRSTNNWGLLESQAFYSTVLPSYYMSGTMHKCNFPSWFGMNSKRNKKIRIVSELYSHARMRVSGDKKSMHLDYAEPIRDLLLRPLKQKGPAGCEDTLEVMKSYSLLREDMLNLFDLLNRYGAPNLYEKIESNVKVALTRLYNKKMVLNFAPPAATKKKKGGKSEVDEELLGEEEEFSDEEGETEENVTDDTLVKVKTKGVAKAGSSKASNTKPESKGKGKTSKRSDGKASKGKGKK